MSAGYFCEQLPTSKLGSCGRFIWRDLKTGIGAVRRAERLFGRGNFSLHYFRDYLDNRTFIRII
jgi:hypothetical protein